MDMQVIPLNEHIIDTAELLRLTLGEHVTLSTLLTPSLGPIQVDPSQLRAAIVDIAARARDAMPHGGRFLIETRNILLDEYHSDVRGAEYVQLSLTYTGSGTPSADEPPVYAFVKQSGGHITTESEVGRGTTVNFHFPRVAITDAAPMVVGTPIGCVR